MAYSFSIRYGSLWFFNVAKPCFDDSFDSSGGPFTFAWGQVLGPCGTLNLDDPSRPVVKIPAVHADDAVLIDRLHLVKDGKMSSADEAEIVVGK